jgi:hypothetical protein
MATFAGGRRPEEERAAAAAPSATPAHAPTPPARPRTWKMAKLTKKRAAPTEYTWLSNLLSRLKLREA